MQISAIFFCFGLQGNIHARHNHNHKVKSKVELHKQLYSKHMAREKYKEMLKQREDLPVYMEKSNIVGCINKNNVVLIAGETGSGKSTQVPHFILEVTLSSFCC